MIGGKAAAATTGTRPLCGIIKFTDDIAAILTDIEKALNSASGGKRVLKGALADKIEEPARLAGFQLENIAFFIQPNEQNSTNPHALQFPKRSGWRNLAELLRVLGERDSWPSGAELASWLRDDAAPRLIWAIRGRGTEEEPTARIGQPGYPKWGRLLVKSEHTARVIVVHARGMKRFFIGFGKRHRLDTAWSLPGAKLFPTDMHPDDDPVPKLVQLIEAKGYRVAVHVIQPTWWDEIS